MAVKWAVANGNWSAGTTWNDGVVPTSGDIVYCNGHTINMTWTTIMVNELRNDANSELSIIAGGYLQLPASNGTFNFVGNIYANGTILTTLNTALRQDIINITGNIHNSNSNFYAVIDYDTNASRNSLNINGNLYGNYCASLFYSGILVVNGTMFPTDDTLPMIGVGTSGERAAGAIINSNVNDITVVASGNATINRLQIIGNAIEENNRMVYGSNVSVITHFIVNENYTNRRTQYYNVTTFTIGGSIYYVGSNNKLGVTYTNITILNPSTFTWKDISEPRSNPFIIVTDAEMNNRQQYPPENEVKEGTEYVWGEKVGTYQAPPESVVLKDFVYDNGDKVGTLENENIVGCVTKEDVREGVELIGLQEVGTLVVPDVDDVREGVVFDNGSGSEEHTSELSHQI